MSLRCKVLGSYRLLLRACRDLCQDDSAGLTRARRKIREEFLKHKEVQSKHEIEDLINTAVEAEKYLRSTVVQLVPVGEDVYRLRITEDTVLPDNPIPPAKPPP